METQTIPTPGFWAILELFGHTKLAGHVSEYQFGGTSFVRVDVPETKTQPSFSKILNNGAIYAITPVDEQLSRLQAENIAARPLESYELSRMLEKKLQNDGMVLAYPTEEKVMSKAQHDDFSDFDENNRNEWN